MKILVAFVVCPPFNIIAAYAVRVDATEGSNHRRELPVVVEEKALLRWACGRHGHLVELLGV